MGTSVSASIWWQHSFLVQKFVCKTSTFNLDKQNQPLVTLVTSSPKLLLVASSNHLGCSFCYQGQRAHDSWNHLVKPVQRRRFPKCSDKSTRWEWLKRGAKDIQSWPWKVRTSKPILTWKTRTFWIFPCYIVTWLSNCKVSYCSTGNSKPIVLRGPHL